MKLPNETVTKIQSTKIRLTYFTNSLQHLKSRNDVLLVFMSYSFSWFQGWRLTKSTFRTFSFKTFGRIFFHKKTFSVSSSSWCFLLNNFFIGLKHSFKNSLVNFLSALKTSSQKQFEIGFCPHYSNLDLNFFWPGIEPDMLALKS